MYKYFKCLTFGKIVLWNYLIWYLVTVFFYFDPNPRIWLNSCGISLIIGIALLLSVGSGGNSWKINKWQTFRLFLMPFCVSSFSSLIKDEGYFLIFPPNVNILFIAAGLCLCFILVVYSIKRINK